MAISLDVTTEDGRRGRVFVRDDAATTVEERQSLISASRAAFSDDDDTPRERLLEEMLGTRFGIVQAHVHPGFDLEDVLHMYVGLPGSRDTLFACVVVSRPRLAAMLEESSCVVEGNALQVSDADRLSLWAIRTAMETWAARNFPEVPTPTFLVEPFEPLICELPDDEDMALDEELSGFAGFIDEKDLPPHSFAPPADLAEAPYEGGE